MSQKRRLGLATLMVMTGTTLSRVLGFARQAVVSAVFGGGAIADILNAVFLVPNNLRKLLAEGALSSAFIPTMARTRSDSPSLGRTQGFMASMFAFQLAVLVPILVGCFVLADPITRLLFHFHEITIPAFAPQGYEWLFFQRMDLSSQLFPWMMLYLLFVSFSAIFIAVLNVHEEFTVSSLAPLLFSVAVIVTLGAAGSSLFVWAQVMGVLLGGGAQVAVLFWAYSRLGYKFRIDWRFWRNPDFRSMFGLFIPGLAASSIFTVTEVVAISLATAIGVGSASAISNAVIFWQLPYGMFSASIATVLFPRLAASLAKTNLDEVRSTLTYGLRMLIYFLIPSSILLVAFGREAIAVALQRGLFTAEETKHTALVLQAYSLGLVFMGISAFLQRAFYAANDRRVPLWSALLIGVVDIVLSLIGIALGFGTVSLALANSLASFGACLWLYALAKKRFGLTAFGQVGRAVGQATVASLPTIGIIALSWVVWPGDWWQAGSTLANWLRVIGIGSLCLGSIFLMYRLLKVDELMVVLRGRGTSEEA